MVVSVTVTDRGVRIALSMRYSVPDNARRLETALPGLALQGFRHSLSVKVSHLDRPFEGKRLG